MAASETAYSCPYTSKCRAVVSFLQLVHACLISEAPSQALVSPIQKKGGCICRASGLYPGRRKAFLPRFVVGFSAQGGSTWFFAELAGALAALAGRKGFAWMRAVRLIGGLRRHFHPAYEYTLVERGQHMRGQLGGYFHDTEVVLDIDSTDASPGDAALAGYGAHQCAGVTSCVRPTSMWSLDMGPDSCLRGSGCILPIDFASAFLAGRCGSIVSSSTSPTLS